MHCVAAYPLAGATLMLIFIVLTLVNIFRNELSRYAGSESICK